MAYNKANLAPVGNQSKPLSGVASLASLKGAPSVWSYATADTAATLNTSGYFNDAAKLLRVGDLIFALTGAGSGGTLAAGLFVVVSNDGTTVDVSNGTTVTLTDSD